MNKVSVLDHGYVELIESWGSDERIVEAARMSTAKGFLGWGTGIPSDDPDKPVVGDEKLLRYLWENGHATPFEMAGAVFEVKAPIFVFREWHRHRTQSYNEMSARYVPLPDENYVPSAERLLAKGGGNKQASSTGAVLDEDGATWFANALTDSYAASQRLYEQALARGVPKELARVGLPVARYSRMRASANLRNWLAFLTLRTAPAAQWEIRQYAIAVEAALGELFPRTVEIFRGGRS